MSLYVYAWRIENFKVICTTLSFKYTHLNCPTETSIPVSTNSEVSIADCLAGQTQECKRDFVVWAISVVSGEGPEFPSPENL